MAMRGRRVIFFGLGGLDRGLAGMRQLAKMLQTQNGGWGMVHFMGAFAPLRQDGEYKEFGFADLWDKADMDACNSMVWLGVHGIRMRTDAAREKEGMALNGGTSEAGVKRGAANVYAGPGGAWTHGGVSKEDMRQIVRQENEGSLRQFQHLAERDFVQREMRLGLRAERDFLVEAAAV